MQRPEPTYPPGAPEVLQLTTKHVGSLDSTGRVITQANPGNGSLKSLVDSTLLVLTAGVEAKRLDVATNLTTEPLYFVGVHRAVSRGNSAFSTWTLVGMDNPSKLTSIVEVSGFAQTANGTPPTSVSGTIGDGTGVVNGLLLAVANGGSVTEWRPTGNGELLVGREQHRVPKLSTERQHHLHARDDARALHHERAGRQRQHERSLRDGVYGNRRPDNAVDVYVLTSMCALATRLGHHASSTSTRGTQARRAT